MARHTNGRTVVVNTAAVLLTLLLAYVCFGGGRPGYFGGAKQCLYDALYRACPAAHAPEARAYALAIDSLYLAPFRAGGVGGLVLIEARTAVGNATDSVALAQALVAAEPEAAAVVPTLVSRFVRENAAPATLGRLTTVAARQRFLDSAAVARWFDPTDSVGFALDPGEVMPAGGLLSLSRVALDSAGTWALVWAGRRDRERRGTAAYLLLRRDDARWRLVASVAG